MNLFKKIKNSLSVRDLSIDLTKKKREEELIKIAHTKFDSGDYKGAIEDYNKIINEFPSNIVLYKHRGDAKNKLRDFQNAIEDYEYLCENKNLIPKAFEYELIDAFCSLGDIKLMMGDYKGAKTDFFKGTYLYRTKHSYKHALAFLGVGKSFYYLDNPYEALINIEKALKLGCLSDQAYFFRGAIFYDDEQYINALDDLTKAFNMKPSALHYLQLKKDTNIKLNNFAEAKKDCTKLIFYDHNKINNLKSRGYCNQKLDNYQEAINDYSESINLDPKNESSFLLRSKAKMDLKQYQDALDDLNQVINLNPQHDGAYYLRSELKILMKEYKSALIDSSKGIELEPNQFNRYKQRIEIRKKLNDTKGEKSDEFTYFMKLGNAEYLSSNFRDSLISYTNAIELNPNDSNAYHERGITHYSLLNYENALNDLKKAIELDPNNKLAVESKENLIFNLQH